MSLAKAYDFSLHTPWRELSNEVKDLFLHGSNGRKTLFKYDENGRVYEVERPFEGILPNLERRYKETGSSWIREEFERYRNNRECASCQGYRLNKEALAVQISGMNIGQMVRLSVKELFSIFESILELSLIHI